MQSKSIYYIGVVYIEGVDSTLEGGMYACMYSYTDAGVAHVELLLVPCLKGKTLRGIKTSSHQWVFYGVPCSLQYIKTEPKVVVCWGEGDGRAIERVSGPPELSQDTSLHHPSSGFL
jgi:hypothetical protein